MIILDGVVTTLDWIHSFIIDDEKQIHRSSVEKIFSCVWPNVETYKNKYMSARKANVTDPLSRKSFHAFYSMLKQTKTNTC